MKQYYIICDVSLCDGCDNCGNACKGEHVNNEWPPYTNAQPGDGHRWMNVLRLERGKSPRIDVTYLPMPCQHCSDPLCAKVNPDCVNRREDGIVLIDIKNAAGNRILTDSCPYDAMYWNEEAGVAQKCTMCAHIIEIENVDSDISIPRCVHSCTAGALEFFHIEPSEMEEKIKDEELECFRPELNGGKSCVYYKNIHKFTKTFITGCVHRSGKHAEGVMVTLTGSQPATAEIMRSQLTDSAGEFKFDSLDHGEYTFGVEGKDLETVTLGEWLDLGNIKIGK